MAIRLDALVLSLAVASGGILGLLIIGPQPAQFDVVYVDGGSGNCQGNTPCVSNITGALGLVNRSGTIVVYGFNGTYNEGLNVDIPVTIMGTDRDTVVINSDFGNGAVVNVGNSDVRLESLTLTGDEYGVDATKVGRLVVRDVTITDTYGGLRGDGLVDFILESSLILDAQAYHGVELQHSDTVRILDSNVSSGVDRGIWINDSHEVTVSGNVIMDNAETGLNVSESVNVTVSNNLISGNGYGFIPFGGGPRPLGGGGGGGGWFWETDPTAVEYNVIVGNANFGVEIFGRRSTDYTLRGNLIAMNNGPGLILTGGPSRLDIASDFVGNRDHGILMDNATDVSIHDALLQGNEGMGIKSQQSMNVVVRDSRILGNGVRGPPFLGTRSSDGPAPTGTPSGGMWFWETDPSAIRGNVIADNMGFGITLIETLDFDILDNTITGNLEGGALLERVDTTRVSGNAFADMPIGIAIQDGCHIRLGVNTFSNVTTNIEIRGTPCDVLFDGLATLRFTPRTLNLASNGNYVTLHFEVTGLDPSMFDLASVVFEVNGVTLVPPPGTPSLVQWKGDTVSAKVKLDRAEAIAAFGSAGDYIVRAMGMVMPGVSWVAEDTVTAILP